MGSGYDFRTQGRQAESAEAGAEAAPEPVHSFPCPYCKRSIAYEARADAAEEHDANVEEEEEKEASEE